MYKIKRINCKICGSSTSKLLGIRGNREYTGAGSADPSQEHIVTNVVKCEKCGFIYTDPLIISETGGYTDPCYYEASSSESPDRLFGFTLNLIEKFHKSGRMLDIGCGKGEFLSVAKKKGWEAHGIETSANFAKYASDTYGLPVKNLPLEKAGYPDDFFDVITLNMVLEHIEEPNSLICGIKNVLKDKGLLFIEVPNMESLMLKIITLYFRLKGKNWSPLLSPLHYPFHSYGYSSSSIRYLLETNGFVIEKILIRDSGLRGFRSDTGGTKMEKLFRSIVARLSGLIGMGDILIVIARKPIDQNPNL